MRFFIGNLEINQTNFVTYKKRWNQKIKKTDIVYILGGLLPSIQLKELNGEKILILSNRDRDIINSQKFSEDCLNEYIEICGYKEIRLNNKLFVLCYSPFLNNCTKETVYSVYAMSYSRTLDELNKNNSNNNVCFLDVNMNTIKNNLPLSEDELLFLLKNDKKKTKIKEINKTNMSLNKNKDKEENQNNNNFSDNSSQVIKRRGRPKGSKNINKESFSIPDNKVHRNHIIKENNSLSTEVKRRGRPRKIKKEE